MNGIISFQKKFNQKLILMFRTVRVPKDKVYAELPCLECDFTFKHIINFQLINYHGVQFEKMCTVCQTIKDVYIDFSSWRTIMEIAQPIINKENEQE